MKKLTLKHMNISIALKKIFSFFIHLAGITDFQLMRFTSDKFLILMYHRILPNSKVNETIEPGMYVTPNTFEKNMCFLKEKFEIVPLSHFLENSTVKNKVVSKKKCAITFDDGWYDFYKYAYPILEKYQIPATVFLPTNFIGTNRIFWTDRLAKLLIGKESRKNVLSSSNKDVQQIIDMKGALGFQLDFAIKYLKKYHQAKIDKIINELSDIINNPEKEINRQFLSWDEVLEMNKSKIISFGSHTVDHLILTTVTKEKANKELINSKEKLYEKKVLDRSFTSFCYPNGSFDKQILEMVKETGYNLAVTTQKGWNDSKTGFYQLKRVGIHEDMVSSTSMFACRILNII